MQAIGYVRVSTDEQHTGPKAQRDALARWAQANGAELVAVFEDLGISGAAPLDARPGLLSALEALTPGAVLVVAKRDRLARDMMSAAMVERMAERSHARIVSSDGVGNGDSPEALLMRRMVDAFAEYERSLIRARTRAALAAKKARGERTGAVPFGWVLTPDGVHLEAVAGEQATIRLARELHESGLSLRKVAAELAERGFCARNGKVFAPAQVQRLLAAQVA